MTSARPSSSMTTRASKASPPIPPSDWGIARPRIPSSANSDQIWRSHPVAVRAMARRRSKVYVSVRNLRSESRIWVCSSVNLKSMDLEAQHVPRDDVALDLVRSSVDGGLAIVEVAAGDAEPER